MEGPNWPIRNKNFLWWQCLSMDRDKMSNLYRGPSIDASYQISVHLGNINKHGHHRSFLFLIGWFLKKSSPLKPPGQMNQNLVGSILGRFSIKIAHFGWGVSEEKIKMWKVNGRRTPSDGKSSHCLWQGELKMFVGSILGRFSIKIAHLVPIR
jgi:hypothetical protein